MSAPRHSLCSMFCWSSPKAKPVGRKPMCWSCAGPCGGQDPANPGGLEGARVGLQAPGQLADPRQRLAGLHSGLCVAMNAGFIALCLGLPGWARVSASAHLLAICSYSVLSLLALTAWLVMRRPQGAVG